VTTRLDDVNELLKLKKGDQGRLEHIKKALEKGTILFVSDSKYLKTLTEQYLINDTEKQVIKHNYEPPVEEKVPTIAHKEKHDDVDELRKKVSDLEEKVEKKMTKPPKKKSSQKKKIGLIIIVIALWVAVAVVVILFFTPFGQLTLEQQSFNNLQEQANRCDGLSVDGGLLSPLATCILSLAPQVFKFCEKYPHSDLPDGGCADVLDSRDKLRDAIALLKSLP